MASDTTTATPAPAAPKKRGGVRAGAGRPCKVIDVPADIDPLAYLQALMTSKNSPETLRLKSAIALANFRHAKLGTMQAKGKKELRAEAAAEAVKPGSQYAPGRAPNNVLQMLDAAKKASAK